MTDCQRACEIVGCPSDENGKQFFPIRAIEWLLERETLEVFRWLSSKHYVINIGHEEFSAPTLTEALTAAVLAVAGENET